MTNPKRTPEEVSAIMRKVHSYDTAPEVALQSVLREQGVVYEVHPADLPGKPDIVLTAARVAVFVDGEFWHGMQWRRRRRAALDEQFKAARNREYWLKKIRRNMQRDCANTSKLLKQGWKVIRFWEKDVLEHPEKCAEMTLRLRDSQVIDDGFSVLPGKTFAEFCAGSGPMRTGLAAQGWTLVFAAGRDPSQLAMRSGQSPEVDGHGAPGAIHELAADLIPSVTLATASLPCNDLSLAGARGGLKSEHVSAFWGFVRILTAMGRRRPPLILVESGAEFLTAQAGADFKQALKILNDLGYAVDTFLLDAAVFAPQSRPRLFVIGSLDAPLGADQPKEEYSFFEDEARPRAVADFILANPDIRWRVRALPSMIGSADVVCVPMIAWIAEHYLDPVVMELLRGRPLQQTQGG